VTSCASLRSTVACRRQTYPASFLTHFTRTMSSQAFLADHALRAFTWSFCYKPCGNAGGLARHQNSSGHGTRPSLSNHARDREWNGPSITVTYHERFRGVFKSITFCICPILTSPKASPVDKHGHVLPAGAPPAKDSSPSPINGEPGDTSSEPWGDFGSRIAFDFAEHHFVKLQSSAPGIARGLNIWAAQALRANEQAQWSSPEELYHTIDTIKLGDIVWATDNFSYTGKRPNGAAPKWMDTTYELCCCDIRAVIHKQLAAPEFKDKVEYRPYMQFNRHRRRIYSNVMSGNRAWMCAVRIVLYMRMQVLNYILD
jgi:hypothetical protein